MQKGQSKDRTKRPAQKTRREAYDCIATDCDEGTARKTRAVKVIAAAFGKKSVETKRTAKRKHNSAFNACLCVAALVVCRDNSVGKHLLFELTLARQGGLPFVNGPIVEASGIFNCRRTNTINMRRDECNVDNGRNSSGYGEWDRTTKQASFSSFYAAVKG